MTKVEKFEDLIAWQKACVLVKDIYQESGRGSFARDYGLRDQIRRSAVSAMSNIAECFERFNPGEYLQYLMIAKSSCAEVRSQLFVALDVGYIDKACFDRLQKKAVETSRVLGGLRAAIQKRKE